MKKTFTTFWLVIFTSIFLSAQVQYIDTYEPSPPNSTKESANFTLATSDGGYLLVGTAKHISDIYSDGLVIKMDANGNELWRWSGGGNFEDVLYEAVELDNYYYVIGTLKKVVNSADRNEMWILKFNRTTGVPEVIEDYNFTIDNTTYEAEGFTIEKTHGNNLVVGGYYEIGGSDPFVGVYMVLSPDTLNVLTDSSNEYLLWTYASQIGKIRQSLDGGNNYYIFGVDYDPSEYSCLSAREGSPQNVSTTAAIDKGDVVVRKANGSLNTIWERSYGGVTADFFRDGVATEDGGFALFAYTYCGQFIQGEAIGFQNICNQEDKCLSAHQAFL